MDKVNVAVIGCGKISEVYFENMCNVYDVLEVKACADLDQKKAEEKAEKYSGVKVASTEEILNDPEIDIVVNLTIPGVHYEINKQILEAGKHAYCEKPLTLNRDEGKELVELAEKKGLMLSCAPDTFLGGGIQTCRKIIDEKVIGEPIGATCNFLSSGHESWHPAPEFYYKAGGGPMFDMGPYYLTALVYLLGGVDYVAGMTQKTFETRTITSEPLNGTVIDVDVPTHIEGLMKFKNGTLATITTSFDVKGSNKPMFEIYGTEGTLQVSNPNNFKGPVVYKIGREGEWQEAEIKHNEEINRGTGVADMAYALRTGRPHRVTGELAFHVLDLMQAFHESSDTGTFVKIASQVTQPSMLPEGLAAGVLD
ncbi:MAG: Gfo/Idh/MocA family protein [Planctomycetota bacterium]|jgi:predicted dehydrogenase